MRIHTGEKPYFCSYQNCSQTFSQMSNLIRHKKAHYGIKPFVCEVCKKSFTSSSNMKQHMAVHNSGQIRSKYNCPYDECQKSYFYLCTLNKHINIHHPNGNPIKSKKNFENCYVNPTVTIEEESETAKRTQIQEFNFAHEENKFLDEKTWINQKEYDNNSVIIEKLNGSQESPGKNIDCQMKTNFDNIIDFEFLFRILYNNSLINQEKLDIVNSGLGILIRNLNEPSIYLSKNENS